MTPASQGELNRLRERVAEHFRTGATVAVKYETMPRTMPLDATFSLEVGPYRIICELTIIDANNKTILGVVQELQEIA